MKIGADIIRIEVSSPHIKDSIKDLHKLNRFRHSKALF